ncbi:unnamed protein product [Schistosoma curassoni]|uniref:Type II restriction endonuclease n=1 Tax=Schistosoma curassoni TaxID=6186 RepID=A0A183K4K9_9TREM|nr:unnamed protein product [Schistosoma curassoni]
MNIEWIRWNRAILVTSNQKTQIYIGEKKVTVVLADCMHTSEKKYIFKVRTDILIGELRKQAIETYNLKELDFINYGLYLPPESGKKGKFLQDERTISEYPQLVAMKLNPYNDNQLLREIESNGSTNDKKSKEPVVLEVI